MVLAGRANPSQEAAASLRLALLNHGQHSSLWSAGLLARPYETS